MIYVLHLPDLPQWTLNSRAHWTERADIVAAWRLAAKNAANNRQLPKGLDRVEITLTMVPADRRRRDPDGIVGALKPTIDGLVDARVLADDSWRHVALVSCRIDTPDPELTEHAWVLEVRDITGEAAA